MVSRHLMLKLYLWLLFALTVSIAAASGVVWLTARHGLEQRWRDAVLGEVRLGRDVAQNLLQSELHPEAVRRVLAPLAESHRLAVSIVHADGEPLLVIAPPDAQDVALPAPVERQSVLRDGAQLELGREHKGRAVLPIALADGNRGLFTVVALHRHWGPEHPPWRLLGGIAALLATLWLLSWPLAAHLARPLQRMADAADALGGGDLSVRIRPEDLQRRHRRRPRRDEIGRLAERFNRMAENLQRLLTAHKQLLADISHELRTPLARLRVALEMARDMDAERRGGYLDTVEQQADAMEALIEELLLFARLEQAPGDLRTESLAAAAVAAEALAAQRPEAEARQVALVADVAPDVPPFAAERVLLLRALGNVLRNAVAHGPAGSTVTLRVTAPAGGVAFTVIDEGPGVPPEQRERIFAPFVRTDVARSRAGGGVGLGLAIARRSMAAHGGGATADVGPGGTGLAVELWLPRGEGD